MHGEDRAALLAGGGDGGGPALDVVVAERVGEPSADEGAVAGEPVSLPAPPASRLVAPPRPGEDVAPDAPDALDQSRADGGDDELGDFTDLDEGTAPVKAVVSCGKARSEQTAAHGVASGPGAVELLELRELGGGGAPDGGALACDGGQFDGLGDLYGQHVGIAPSLSVLPRGAPAAAARASGGRDDACSVPDCVGRCVLHAHDVLDDAFSAQFGPPPPLPVLRRGCFKFGSRAFWHSMPASYFEVRCARCKCYPQFVGDVVETDFARFRTDRAAFLCRMCEARDVVETAGIASAPIVAVRLCRPSSLSLGVRRSHPSPTLLSPAHTLWFVP